ncbi:MAG TPA: hypothetical protein VK699_06090 [Terriglobales bacterium]|jgi:hypothetical protein|nr:hypothetical protein [Terriglobales bacterium]
MSSLTNPSALFQEEQRVWRPWIIAIHVPLFLAFGLFDYGVWRQVVRGIPLGDQQMSDSMLLFLAIGTSLLLVWTFRFMDVLRLITVVDGSGISVRLTHLQRCYIPLANIRNAFVRNCIAIERGGWVGGGVRLTWKGWAYVLWSRHGVQLELSRGWPVFVGSQRCDELLAAIQQAKQNAPPGSHSRKCVTTMTWQSLI